MACISKKKYIDVDDISMYLYYYKCVENKMCYPNQGDSLIIPSFIVTIW